MPMPRPAARRRLCALALAVLASLAALALPPTARAGAPPPEAASVPGVAEVTDPPIRLTSDKTEILRLPAPAGSVMVGNPKHLGALVENATTLILVPREPGSSFLTVLGAGGQTLVARHVIVGAPKSRYLRVRQNCAGDAANCQAMTTYYCPDMCHPIVPDLEGETSTGPGATSDGAADIVIPELGDMP
jgi:hypothetical protein